MNVASSFCWCQWMCDSLTFIHSFMCCYFCWLTHMLMKPLKRTSLPMWWTWLAGCRMSRLTDASTDLKSSRWVDDKAGQEINQYSPVFYLLSGFIINPSGTLWICWCNFAASLYCHNVSLYIMIVNITKINLNRWWVIVKRLLVVVESCRWQP